MYIDTPPFAWLSSVNALFYNNISYSSGSKQDYSVIMPADATEKTPCIVYIHGGSFVYGDKTDIWNTLEEQEIIVDYVNEGICFISINYDLLQLYNEIDGISSCMQSCALALQTIKYNADFYNIDKDKIVLMGGSAGAGIALWLSSQPSLADPLNRNLILREETTVEAVSLYIPQATYDFQEWEDRVFPSLGYNIENDYTLNAGTRAAMHRSYAIDSYEAMFVEPTITMRAHLNMLGMIDSFGGVPTFIKCSNPFYDTIVHGTIQDINHNDYHGLAIKNALEAKGVTVVAYLEGLNILDSTGQTEGEFIREYLLT
jgi:acetyl esterase/lipase